MKKGSKIPERNADNSFITMNKGEKKESIEINALQRQKIDSIADKKEERNTKTISTIPIGYRPTAKDPIIQNTVAKSRKTNLSR
ncbi:MAG TPA: hypothetical protein O0W88_02490 [Methanocorpusculum sp.]|nr:hypothetical protein [Methanocorpusculum sp.]